jgi:hypothetical protein
MHINHICTYSGRSTCIATVQTLPAVSCVTSVVRMCMNSFDVLSASQPGRLVVVTRYAMTKTEPGRYVSKTIVIASVARTFSKLMTLLYLAHALYRPHMQTSQCLIPIIQHPNALPIPLTTFRTTTSQPITNPTSPAMHSSTLHPPYAPTPSTLCLLTLPSPPPSTPYLTPHTASLRC